MANGRYGGVIRQVDTLFGAGSVAGLADGPLLDRFARRDGEGAEAAFAVLVERHGPMVLRVCRSIVRDPEEAQDAFQAVFLVLAVRSGSIRDRDALASWLHGVAARVAAHARSAVARRRERERTAAGRRREAVAGGPGGDDLAGPLLDELNRLPARQVAPIVLCYLEGLTHEQAARRLGLPVGTVRSRLARGRDRLKRRLASRGLASHLGALPVIPSAMPSSSLIAATARAATHAAAGETPLSAVASASAASLAVGVLRSMTMIRWKMAASLALTLGLLGAGAAVVAQSAGAVKKEPGAKVRADNSPPTAEQLDRVIRNQLDKRLDFDLPADTTLEGLLKYIRLNTRDEANGLPQGIPIYIDSAALQEGNTNLESRVMISKGSTVKAALSQAFRQHHLAFDVQDGLLLAISQTDAIERRLGRVEEKLDRILKALDDAKRDPGR